MGGYWLLGWSDVALFAIFDFGHIAADQEYFLSSIPKKSANLTKRARAVKFLFLKKITGTLKMFKQNIFSVVLLFDILELGSF